MKAPGEDDIAALQRRLRASQDAFTAKPLLPVIDEIFLTPDGQRVDRHGAARVARRAGITKPVGRHTLRRAFITAALDAGVPLRDVQEAASYADSMVQGRPETASTLRGLRSGRADPRRHPHQAVVRDLHPPRNNRVHQSGARASLDRHAPYVVAAYLAGAAR